MNEQHLPFIEKLVTRWVEFTERYSTGVVVGIFILTIFSILFIKENLGMSTSTKNMLSEELPWRQLDLEDEKLFPQFLNNILIVIDANTPDQAIDSANEIFSVLNRDSKYINDIYYPSSLPYFQQSAFLFLDLDELQDLADRLAAIQPFLGTLMQDKNLRGLFNMLSDALTAKQDGEDIDIKPLLEEINRVFQNDDYYISWQKLMNADADKEPPYREFIVVQVNDINDDILPGEKVLTQIRSVIKETEAYKEKTINVRLTGGIPLSNEELKSVSKANIQAIVISLILVSIILVVGLGSGWLVISCLITLITGLIVTTAFATLTVGELNLISVAFAVLYIGLGIDFAIHLTLRYREELVKGTNKKDLLKLTTKRIYRSLLLCAVSTAIGFYSFIPTDYQGVAELGWIAGSGMFISIFFTFTLLPALLSLKQNNLLSEKVSARNNVFLLWLGKFSCQYSRQILMLTFIVTIIILTQIDRIKFDTNTLNLQDPENESVQTYRDLLGDSNTSPWNSILLKRGKEETTRVIQQLETLPLVDNVIWLEDLLPEGQEEKLFIIDEMNLFMGQLDTSSNPGSVEENERKKSIIKLTEQLNDYSDPSIQTELHELNNHLLHLLNQNPDNSLLVKLENKMLKNLDGRLDALSYALAAEELELEDIPAEIHDRWLNNNYYRIQITPRENLNDNIAMKNFVELIQSHDKQVIGSPVIKIEAGKAVVTAFRDAFSYALIAIALLLLFLIKIKTDAAIILVSVLIGAIFTCGFMLLFNMPLNFANIIGLPLLLGIGVDSGIHITDRFRQDGNNNQNIYLTSSSRGVIVSSLTTICSISNLAFSSHQGTASMGILLTTGLASMMISTMIILPAFLIWQQSIKGNK